MIRPKRLTWRISLALMVSIGVAVIMAGLGSGWFVYSLAKSTLIHESMQEISQTTKTSAHKLTEEYRQHPGRAPVEDLNDLAAAGHLYVLLITPSGHFIGSSGSLPPALPQNGWVNAGSSGWFPFHTIPYVFASSPLTLNGQARRLIIVDGLDRTAALLSTLRTALLFGELLLVLSSTLAVVIIVRQLTDPLRSLEHLAQTTTLSRKNSNSVDIHSRLTEVASLTDSFNNMLERLQKAQERERQFTSNAAHSLRTPIHVIRGYIHTLNQWGHEDPETRHLTLKALARESQAMETLVDRLLQLSRMEQDDPPGLRPVVVAPYVAKILPRLRDTCLHHPLVLDWPQSPVPPILSEPNLLEAVLRTLVENADAYGDPETPVAIFATYRLNNNKVRIGVRNYGPDIPADVLNHLFDRFYRASQPASSHHFGLGLSIADSIVGRIQGEWYVKSLDHETVFAVDLPRADS